MGYKARAGTITLGIDASRNRSGGARAYIIGILKNIDPERYGINKVHLWAYRELLDAIPERPWLVKHRPRELEQSLFKQIYWQRTQLPKALVRLGCSIVLNTDAGTVLRFKPSITLSQDMLSYEPGEMERFGLSKARMRLLALKRVQNKSLQSASGAIFLTKYAGDVIQHSCGTLPKVAYIPHGVGSEFKSKRPKNPWPASTEQRPIRCLYISNTAMYKHQWIVVRAVDRLRNRGYNIQLDLVGEASGRGYTLLKKQLMISDPHRQFVTQHGFVPQKHLPEYLSKADLFVFASSCENMPITLLEAMAVGLPIACSNRGPMPEVLSNAGVYFDPEDEVSMAEAIESLMLDTNLRVRSARRAKMLSEQYSWARCADNTMKFVVDTYQSLLV